MLFWWASYIPPAYRDSLHLLDNLMTLESVLFALVLLASLGFFAWNVRRLINKVK